MRSRWPVARIWRANTGDSPPAEELVLAADGAGALGVRPGPPGRGEAARAAGGAGALVVRPALSVRVEALGPAECAFAGTLLAGGDPMAAEADAAARDGEFEIVPAFRNLLAAGAFAGLAGEKREGAQA